MKVYKLSTEQIAECEVIEAAADKLTERQLALEVDLAAWTATSRAWWKNAGELFGFALEGKTKIVTPEGGGREIQVFSREECEAERRLELDRITKRVGDAITKAIDELKDAPEESKEPAVS